MQSSSNRGIVGGIVSVLAACCLSLACATGHAGEADSDCDVADIEAPPLGAAASDAAGRRSQTSEPFGVLAVVVAHVLSCPPTGSRGWEPPPGGTAAIACVSGGSTPVLQQQPVHGAASESQHAARAGG